LGWEGTLQGGGTQRKLLPIKNGTHTFFGYSGDVGWGGGKGERYAMGRLEWGRKMGDGEGRERVWKRRGT